MVGGQKLGLYFQKYSEMGNFFCQNDSSKWVGCFEALAAHLFDTFLFCFALFCFLPKEANWYLGNYKIFLHLTEYARVFSFFFYPGGAGSPIRQNQAPHLTVFPHFLTRACSLLIRVKSLSTHFSTKTSSTVHENRKIQRKVMWIHFKFCL